MNLAEAIRKAALEGTQAPATPAPAPPTVVEETKPSTVTLNPDSTPETPHAATFGGNVVRIELFMTHEQTSNLLRAIMTGQHTVLTVGEAANYLRVKPQTLAKKAEDGEIPAVEIDGKWRFLKSSLDEWLAINVFHADTDQDGSHAA